jgi:hypothetical protein
VLPPLLGYGLAVQPGRNAAVIAPKLSLGALHRSLLDRFDSHLGLRVGIHFEERTSVVAEQAAAGTESKRIEQRTFDADLVVREGVVTTATLTAGAMGTPALVIRISEVLGATRYFLAGEGFGLLAARPDLFDLADFESRLDQVTVIDAVVDQETPDGTGRIVVDAEVDTDAFARLLQAFGGAEAGNPELPLLSHSVVLSASGDVTLDYWWSLLGLDEVEGRPARHNVVVCHVQASFGALTGGEAAPTDAAEATLPVLADLDAVWGLARERRAS